MVVVVMAGEVTGMVVVEVAVEGWEGEMAASMAATAVEQEEETAGGVEQLEDGRR